MIRDKGIVILMRLPKQEGRGNMPGGREDEYYRAWYGERTVGMSRYYAAQQANTRIDLLIRILAPPDSERVMADDVAVIGENRYRVTQAAYLFDPDAGENVVDLSLERAGYRDGNNL